MVRTAFAEPIPSATPAPSGAPTPAPGSGSIC